MQLRTFFWSDLSVRFSYRVGLMGLVLCFTSACSIPLPLWLPTSVKAWIVTNLGIQDSRSILPPVSSDDVDGKLPPNSVSVNQKILDEMIRVVFLREPISPKEFSGLLDVLNQGASFEGVYNGLVHSAEYRQLEDKGKPALPNTLQTFAEEWTRLQMELPADERTPLTAALALPLAPIEAPQEGDAAEGALPSSPASPSSVPSYASREEEQRSIQRLTEETFLRANVHTMKRVMGSEIFKVFSQKKRDRTVLADWYARWCVRVAATGVDFAYPQRQDDDIEFHREWAWNASTDRLQWEVLFRMHRILNESESKR